MANTIEMNINTSVPVQNTDFEVTVRNDTEGKVGTLLISKGNLEWLPANHSVNKYQLSYVQLAGLMVAEGIPKKTAQAKPRFAELRGAK